MRAGIGLVVAFALVCAPAADAHGPHAAAGHRTAEHRAPHHRAAQHAHHHVAVASSLYSGPGPRPGPAILYEPVATAPELENTGIWHAQPILVSGSEAYRDGEFLYQDYLYDDDGAHEVRDPADPRFAEVGDLFSMTNGTYTYPTGPGYDENAADLVEFRVKPTATATAFRITMNTLANPALVAFTIAIGGTPGDNEEFPDGANVVAPASLFLTVHEVGGTLQGQLIQAGSGAPVAGPAPTVTVDSHNHQIQVEVPHSDWNPGASTVRLAMGVGLWDSATNSYLLPSVTAGATAPGGAGVNPHPAAFFNVAFRTHEPQPSLSNPEAAELDPAWWRDQQQGQELADGTIAPFYADVNFGMLERRVTDDAMIPHTGSFDMILPSHFDLGQGESFAHTCGLTGSAQNGSCSPEYLGDLQPFNIYVPPGPAPKAGYGMTLLLHSLSANYNQFATSNNQSQFGDRAHPSITITPESRGPDQFYGQVANAEVFETWAEVAHLYHLDPAYTDIAGYSMGGIGTYQIAEQFPDLFARAQPTVGDESDHALLASLRNIPMLMWNNTADELVGAEDYLPDEQQLGADGYRFQLDAYRPCASTYCSPIFPDHLELAINDQYAPAAAFLGSATVDVNPAHITYVVDPGRDSPKYGVVANHAYWISNLTVSGGAADGEIDAISKGFGVGDPKPSGVKLGIGTLAGGRMGAVQYAAFTQTWGPVPKTAPADEIDITATDLTAATIAVKRADVNCAVNVVVHSNVPIALTLANCGRTIHAG